MTSKDDRFLLEKKKGGDDGFLLEKKKGATTSSSSRGHERKQTKISKGNLTGGTINANNTSQVLAPTSMGLKELLCSFW